MIREEAIDAATRKLFTRAQWIEIICALEHNWKVFDLLVVPIVRTEFSQIMGGK